MLSTIITKNQTLGMSRNMTSECDFGASVGFSVFTNIFVFVKG